MEKSDTMSYLSPKLAGTSAKNIPMDCVRVILNMLHPTQVAGVDVTQAYSSRLIVNSATTKIQRWYRLRKLNGGHPYDRVTMRTLIRFYIVKYKEEWLQELPAKAIRKLALTGPHVAKYLDPTPAMRLGKVRTFLQFCEDFSLTTDHLDYYGW